MHLFCMFSTVSYTVLLCMCETGGHSLAPSMQFHFLHMSDVSQAHLHVDVFSDAFTMHYLAFGLTELHSLTVKQ